MNPNVRRPDELFKDYKERLREERIQMKSSWKKFLWNSSVKGTYVRDKHGELS